MANSANRLAYTHEGTALEAYVAQPKSGVPIKGTLLLFHAWDGRGDFICEQAQRYAGKGFLAIALDQYGKGIVGRNDEENAQYMNPLVQDRAFLASRLKTGYDAALERARAVKAEGAIFAMGYCFGGLCALDLLRTGVILKGVISIHGLLFAPKALAATYHAEAKVLALTGYQDPMVDVAQVNAFEAEMNQSHLDWELVVYGAAMHAFTNPHASKPQSGLLHHALSEKRAYAHIDRFLSES